MDKRSEKVIKQPSDITYNYATINVTQSRIDKGLLAIPVGLAESFPKQNKDVEVFLDNSPVSQPKRYSSYNSSTHECRIGGLKEWFVHNDIERGDEIVVQFLDKKHFIYRLIPEKKFIFTTKDIQKDFDNARTEREASSKVQTLSNWTLSDEKEVVLNEFQRLTDIPATEERLYTRRNSVRLRESVPANLRALLSKIYKGNCQICDFGFLRQDKQPYFEIHHIDPNKGHHPKNVIVVCGNCHNQFEYANVQKENDEENWLIRVFFNEEMYLVKQILPSLKKEGFIKETFI